jgi:hypothetical protein
MAKDGHFLGTKQKRVPKMSDEKRYYTLDGCVGIYEYPSNKCRHPGGEVRPSYKEFYLRQHGSILHKTIAEAAVARWRQQRKEWPKWFEVLGNSCRRYYRLDSENSHPKIFNNSGEPIGESMSIWSSNDNDIHRLLPGEPDVVRKWREENEVKPEPCHECDQLRLRIERQIAHIKGLQEALSRKNQEIRVLESCGSLAREIEQTPPNAMTPRLRIATAAMQELIGLNDGTKDDIARESFDYADAMLSAERRNP